MKKAIIAIIVISLLYLWYIDTTAQDTPAVSYQTETISRGDILRIVSATGALAAVDDVVVGSQLSGQIIELLVDFNDKVEMNQLLARIDPRTFKAKVSQYQAQLANIQANIKLQQIMVSKARVNARQTTRNRVRGEGLLNSKNISRDQLELLQTNDTLAKLEISQANAQLDAFRANLASTQAQLDQATIELDRTEIRAPISGIIINRTVEAGQTVASSYNTPELFVIAKDLSQMEIEAYVDESDIGLIKEGLHVEFSVDAYPEQRFIGQIRQLRQYPQTDSGVVTYTVIITAQNPRRQLLPGMTADLKIQIDTANDVIRVPSSALRIAARQADSKATDNNGFLNSQSMLKQLDLTEQQLSQLATLEPTKSDDPFGRNREQTRQRMEKAYKKVLTTEQFNKFSQLRNGKSKIGQVLLIENGVPKPVNVQTGLSDDQYTEINLEALIGQEVVTQIKETRR